MRCFIRKAVLFALGLLLYFCVNLGINYLLLQREVPNVKQANVLIMGDSHVQRALNPSLLHNAVNIAQYSEPYAVSFWKLKNVNPIVKPDTLILGFSPHNISGFNDLKFSSKKSKLAEELFKRTYCIGDWTSLKSIEVDEMKLYGVYFRQMCFFPHQNHLNYIGEYVNSNSSNLTNIQIALDRHFFTEKENPFESSALSIGFLYQIVEFCKKESIHLILLDCPTHQNYKKGIPHEMSDEYKKLCNELIQKGISIIEIASSHYADSLFFDADHLNTKGATKFTNQLSTIFSKN